jgi:aminoglycoside 3-N-acetyltransferase
VHSRQSLSADLRALGVSPGDVVMAHASVRAIGEIAGGPDQIHLAIKDALTPSGTLMMYASCPRYYDEVGRGNLSADEEAEILEKLPAFDAETARSARDNGALVEMLRTYPGSLVNQHVARFVVWGAKAEHLISKQPWDYAFGRDSALDRFVALDGKILLLGSDHDTVTFLHYAEHIGDFPGKKVARYRVPVVVNGARVWRDMAEFDTSAEGAHANWPDRFFALLTDGYLVQSGNTGAKVGEAQSYLIPASGLLDFALRLMARVAEDRQTAHGLREIRPALG